MTSDTSLPDRSGGLSRRSLLATLGLGSLGVLATPSLLGCNTRAGAATPTVSNKPSKSPKPGRRPKPNKPRKQVVLDANGNYVQPGPYQVQASCTLSEDYFLTDEILIDLAAGDKVIPFTNTATGLVEAVVLCGGSVSHLRRDPGSITGWSYQTIDTQLADNNIAAVDAAVTSSSAYNAMLVVTGVQGGGQMMAALLSLQSATDWAQIVMPPVNTPSGPISAGTTSAGGIYVSGWVQSNDAQNANFDFFQWNCSPDGLNPVDVGTASYPLSAQVSITSAQLLLDASLPGGGAGDFAVLLLNQPSGASVVSYSVNAAGAFATIGSAEPGVAALLWSTFTSANTSGAPAVAWQTTDGAIEFVDETGAQANLYAGSNSGPGQVALWQQSGEYTFAILDDATVNIVSQFGSGGQSGFTAPIPMVNDLAYVYSQPTDSAESTLFAIDLDTGLSVLTRDSTGWVQNVVHQDGLSMNEVTAWRVRLTVTDTNLVGVSGATVSLTPDRPIGIWLDGSGSTYATPTQSATITLDGSGRSTFCIPAAELDTAQLTAQAYDTGGNASGSPFTIIPNTDVQNFLAGTSGVGDLGTLTPSGPSVLLSATSQTWDETTGAYVSNGPLFTGLTSLPSNAQSASATSVAGAINHLANLGLGVTPSTTNPTQSTLTDLTGSQPTFAASPDPNAYSLSTAGPTGSIFDSSWWDSAAHDLESAMHGLRHDAIKVTQLATQWVKDADTDAGNWVCTLVVDIGDGIDHLMDYVISDIRTAIHAISGLFQALGADLEDAWEWLKNHILALIQNAEANAKIMEGWCGQLGTELTSVLTQVSVDADTFAATAITDVNGWITTLADEVEKDLFGSVAPLPTPSTSTGSTTSSTALEIAGGVEKFMHYATGNWLFDKLKAYLPNLSGDDIIFDPSAFEQDITDLATDVQAALSTIEATATFLLDALKTFGGSPQSFSQASFTALFGAFTNMVDDVITMLNDWAQTILALFETFAGALSALFTSEFNLVPLIGDLLKLAGIDTSTSIQHLICLVVAFPATLIAEIAQDGDGTLFPGAAYTSTDTARLATRKADLKTKHAKKKKNTKHAKKAALGSVAPIALESFGFNITSAVLQTIWAVDDVALDVELIAQTVDPDLESVGLWTAIDWVCPALMTFLQWPTPPSKTNALPFQYKDFSDKQEFGNWNTLLPGVVVTTAVPWMIEGLFQALSVKWDDDDGIVTLVNNYVVPVVQMLGGGVNTILSAWYAYQNSDTDAEKSNAIISAVVPNLSYIDALLGIREVILASEDFALPTKILMDSFSNFGTVAILAAEAFAAL